MAAQTIPADARIKNARHPNVVTGRAAEITLLDRLRFRSHPALAPATALAAGIALSHLFSIAPGWLLIIGLLPLLFLNWCSRNINRIALVPLFAAWLVLGFFISEIQPHPSSQRDLLAFSDGAKHTIIGEVSRFGSVRIIESQQPFSNEVTQEQQLQIQLAVRSVDGLSVAGGLRLAVFAPMHTNISPVHCGDTMTLRSALKEPQVYHDPGVWDGGAWLLSQGVSVLAAANAADINLPIHQRRGSVACWIKALQVRASSRLVSLGKTSSHPSWLPAGLAISDGDAAMLTAIITGDRTYLERSDRQGFERTGAFHVLVVSGLHVGLISVFILAATKRLAMSIGWAAALTGMLTTCYAVFTGFGAPVQRALAMVLLFLAARAIYRDRDPLHALGVAALVLLAWNPAALFDAGLQMTMLTVIATGGIAAPLAERTFGPYLKATLQIGVTLKDAGFPPRLAQFRLILRLIAECFSPAPYLKQASEILAWLMRIALRMAELLVMSVVVEVLMALPMALYFHRITVLALPVNLLFIPGLGVLLPVAVITALFTLVLPHFAVYPGAMLAVLLHFATAIVHFFAGIDLGDVRVASPSILRILLVLGMLGATVWALRRRRLVAVACMLGGTLSIALLLWPAQVKVRAQVLEISALDVGQGDALFVATPLGKTLMIDCGGPTGGNMAQHGNFEIGEDVVSPVLWARGIHRLDAIVLSHAHSDHMGGMFAVLNNFHPRELWIGNNPPTREYTALLAEAGHLHVEVRHFHAGDVFTYGGMDVRVLAPSPEYVPGPSAKNDDSLVLRIAYRGTSALLEGDAEAPSETRMATLPAIHSDLLKVGHHGSKTSTTAAFLKAVAPKYAVVSVGLHNLYHHPRFETLEHLQAAGVRTYRTDLDGLSTFYLDGERITSAP